MAKYIILFFLSGSITALGQELNCKIVVNAQQVQATERNIFDDMEVAFTQFINNRKWTDEEYKPEERINCNIIVNLDKDSKPAGGQWSASVQILSARPVYNTDYETVVFNFGDRNWNFDYLQSQPLQFNTNTFTSNITSLLAYYAYIIIGLDHDTFSELGGTEFYKTANQIVSNAQTSNYKEFGWDQFNSVRNRYWLVENLISSNFEPLRKALYSYHITGLDIFTEKPEEARANILQGLKDIEVVNRSRPRSVLTISFLDAKAEELTQIFKEGSQEQKRSSYDILSKIDPGNADTFRKIIE